MEPLYLFSPPPSWWADLQRLEAALGRSDSDHASCCYARLFHGLAWAGYEDLPAAAADALLYRSTPFSRAAMVGAPPAGLHRAFESDLATLLRAVHRDWADEVRAMTKLTQPALMDLADRPEGADRTIAEALVREEPKALATRLEAHYRRHGDGELARHLAYRWAEGVLAGIEHPSMPRMSRLVGLDRQLSRISENTEAFLLGRPAHHTLLYGPRGSGKSTAVRALLPKHHAEGLRLVEISPERLDELPVVLERLRLRPHRYIVFVDDLSFEAGDTAYHPLKTLLEGSLTAPPSNVLLYATSNRRHLVRESFSDRPDPLDDDVHAWDTQHERLALADRFGLAITFPDAGQRRYLEIVRALVADDTAAAAVFSDGADAEIELDERAIRFAEWGNGYSGRTAEQFVRTLRGRGEI